MSTPADLQQSSYQPMRTLPLQWRLFLKLMKSSPLVGEEVVPGVTRLLSAYSAVFILSTTTGKYVLIDTGIDKKATEIMKYLASRGAAANDVEAIFLTHGHADHIAALGMFPQATVYVGEGDRGYVEGAAKSDGLLPGLAGKLKTPAVDLARLKTIQDNEIITTGSLAVRAFAIPGHTQGSMAYLANNALFVGDSVTFNPQGKAQKPPAPLSYNVPKALSSLAQLLARLESEQLTPQVALPNHSGGGTMSAIRELINN